MKVIRMVNLEPLARLDAFADLDEDAAVQDAATPAPRARRVRIEPLDRLDTFHDLDAVDLRA
jgi:hypothetical protein